LAIGFVGLLVMFGALLRGLMQWFNMQGLAPGFLIGLALGAMLGGLAVKIAHGLVSSLSPPRTERLLLRYFDALTEVARESAAAGPVEATGATDGRGALAASLCERRITSDPAR
jgi:hypothetical protein